MKKNKYKKILKRYIYNRKYIWTNIYIKINTKRRINI